jgi:hypothetical protein
MLGEQNYAKLKEVWTKGEVNKTTMQRASSSLGFSFYLTRRLRRRRAKTATATTVSIVQYNSIRHPHPPSKISVSSYSKGMNEPRKVITRRIENTASLRFAHSSLGEKEKKIQSDVPSQAT